MKPDQTLIFDLDDTLIDTMSLYRQAVDEFVQLMVKQGFDEAEARSCLNRIDVQNISRQGFSRDRFPASLLETYNFLSQKHAVQPKESVRQLCIAIGRSVFQKVPVLLDGAWETLELLKPHFQLILLTKGDRAIQEMRLDQAGIRPFFDTIHIVADKTPALLADIIRRKSLDPERTWLVGDSARSDINPALQAGIGAVWIKRNTWVAEQEPVKSNSVIVLRSLHDLIALFKSRMDVDATDAG